MTTTPSDTFTVHTGIMRLLGEKRLAGLVLNLILSRFLAQDEAPGFLAGRAEHCRVKMTISAIAGELGASCSGVRNAIQEVLVPKGYIEVERDLAENGGRELSYRIEFGILVPDLVRHDEHLGTLLVPAKELEWQAVAERYSLGMMRDNDEIDDLNDIRADLRQLGLRVEPGSITEMGLAEVLSRFDYEDQMTVMRILQEMERKRPAIPPSPPRVFHIQ